MNFNIDELRNVQKTKHDSKKQVFDIVLEKCLKLVKFINKNSNETSVWYNVPLLIPGQPIFNMEECMKYLKKELDNYGFKTKCVKPNSIHISWDIINEEPKKPTEIDILEGLTFKTPSKKKK